MDFSGYTTAELGLKVIRHEEGCVTLPAKMLKSVKAEINRRKFVVGDMVCKIEFGPNAEPRRVEEVGTADYVLGYIRVSGLLGWHSAKSFVKARP